MELDTIVYICVGILAGAWLLLCMFTVYLWTQNRRLAALVANMSAGKLRVQKLKMDSDINYAYQNPGITPGEELSRRGYSMYMGNEQDVESNHSLARQTSGPVFVDESQRNKAAQRTTVLPEQRSTPVRDQPSTVPPFLLQAIQENKIKSKALSNPVANNVAHATSNRDSNFIY